MEEQPENPCPFRFPGQYEDTETGLYYNRHRHYDPLTAQYCTPDPIGLAGGDRPQGYVDRPDVWVDPLGLKSSAGGAKRGPKTDPNAPHNKKIREHADELAKKGNEIQAGGGRLPERMISVKSKTHKGRRPDIIYKTPKGEIRGVNVGKTKADGTPVTREIKALKDLGTNPSIKMDPFVRYD